MKKQNKILSVPVFIAIYLGVIVVSIVLDQLTKIWIFDGMLRSLEGSSVSVIGEFLRFTAVYNEGAIFGLMKGRAADIAFFIITVAATPLYAYFLWRSRSRSVWGQVGFAFIIGGALGNAIDRAFINTQGTFFSGQVRDFISFSFFPPVFNVADSFLTVGVILAVIAITLFDPDSLYNVIRDEQAAKHAVATAEQNDIGTNGGNEYNIQTTDTSSETQSTTEVDTNQTKEDSEQNK